MNDLSETIKEICVSNIPWFVILIFSISYIVLESDLFFDSVLSQIDNATSGLQTTTWGTSIKLIILILILIITLSLYN